MKRKLIYTSALAACLAASAAFAGGPEILVEPDYFSGFFVGPTGAFHMAAFPGSASAGSITPITQSATFVRSVLGGVLTEEITQTFFPAGTWTSSAVNGNAFDGYYGVQGGVGKVFNHRWYIGVVGFGEWGDQSSTQNSASQFTVTNANNISFLVEGFNLIFPTTTNTTTGVYANSTTVKISNDYGVAFKPGFLVAPRTMFYGKIGASWANLKVSNGFSATSQGTTVVLPNNINVPSVITYNTSAVMAGASSSEDKKMGLLLGIGGEQFIYKNFITINVEYNYVNYGNVSTTTALAGSSSISSTVTGGATLTQTVPLAGPTAQASANAKVSTLLAGLNFYFGSQWF